MAACERLEDRTLLSAVGPDLAGAAGQTLEIGISPVVDEDRIPPLDEERIASQIPASEAAPPFDLGGTFQLHSNPGATKVIYLDFDGHTTTGTAWSNNVNPGSPIVTPAYSFEGNVSANFTDGELERIQKIWQRVAEDFIPFDVDVTTEDPGTAALRNTGGSDNEWGVRVAIGGSSSDWYGNEAGGVAYVNSFAASGFYDVPAFVFEDDTGNGNEKSTAEAISHEVGHTLGLHHDGTPAAGADYYQGHGSGATGWAPIMGVGYYQELSQWSQGEYSGADNTEDDLQIITATDNGFGYRTDDHGDTNAMATAVNQSGNQIDAAGIIERNDDVDVFSFTSTGGQIELDILPFVNGPNLDILAELYNSAGDLVMASNPLGALSASFDLTLAAGEYFLHIDGTGEGDPLATGYTDYGSLGSYTIVGIAGSRQVYESTDAPKDIPNLETITSTLTITDDLIIDDLNVGLDISHIRANGLDVFLIGPDGTRVELFTDVGGQFDSNFTATILDDEAPPITGGSAPFTGSFAPEGSLADFDGLSAQGTWTLEITDDGSGGFVAGTDGDLNSWSLSILPRAEESLTVTISSSTVDETDGTSATTGTVTRTGDLSQDLVLNLTSSDPSEATVPATVTILAGQDSAEFNITAVDDNLLDGTQTVVITATTGGTMVADIVYGTNGVASIDMWLQDTVLQSDGKLIVAGYRRNSAGTSNDTVVARLHSDGTLDTSFGTNGIAVIKAIDGIDRVENGIAVALQSDGKILVGGELFTPGQDSQYDRAGFIVRLDTLGQIDTSFGSNGGVVIDPTSVHEQVWDLLVLPEDDSILVAGEYQDSAALYRFDNNGNALTFPNGSAHLFVLSVPSDDPNPTGVGDDATTLVLQPDGKILVGGIVYGDYPDRTWGIARLTANLQYDTTFGTDGRIIADVPTQNERLEQLLLQSDGKIVAVGGGGSNTFANELRALARFNADGSLDTSFGDGGYVLTTMDDNALGYAGHIMPDGSILVAGYGGGGSLNRGVLTRYTPNGTLIEGSTTLLHESAGRSIVETADGSILVVGFGGDVQKFTADGFATANGSLNVTDEDTAPQAVDDTATTDDDVAVTIDVLANDTDADGDALILASVTNISGGTVGINADDTITFTPDAGYTGPAGFDYTIQDEDGQSDTATVSVTVSAANFAPVANPDSYTVSENGILTAVGSIGGEPVLRYDFDEASSGNTDAIDSGAAPLTSGTFIDSATRTGNTPGAGSTGALDLTGTGSAYVTPGDLDEIDALTSMTLTLWVNLQADPDTGDLLVSNSVSGLGPAGSTEWSLSIDNGFATPFSASDFGLNFTVSESYGSSGTGRGKIIDGFDADDKWTFVAVTFDRQIQNEAPVGIVSFWQGGVDDAVVQQGFSTTFDDFLIGGFNNAPLRIGEGSMPAWLDDVRIYGHPLTQQELDVVRRQGIAATVLANDTDADGDALTAELVSGPTHGSLTFNADGSFTYTPDANYSGPDSFTYKANDGQLDSNLATVSIYVSEEPVALDDSATINEDTPITIDVLANDTDAEGDALTVTSVSDPPSGTATINVDGTITYTPDADFNGTDSFTYTISTDIGGTDTGTVSFTINAVNDAPIASDDSATTDEDTSVTIDVLANDIDIEGDSLTVIAVSNPVSGTTVLNADGTITYTPYEHFYGAGSFTYTISDGNGETDTATVAVDVNPVNVAPVAVNDAYTVTGNGTLVTSVVPDQSSTPREFIFNVGYDDQNLQQQVTAGMGGNLQSIDLYIYESVYRDQVGGSFTVFVNRGAPWQTDSHDFSQVVTLTAEMIGGWITIDVSSAGIALSEGEVFSIGVEATPGQDDAIIMASDDQQYSGGALWVNGNLHGNGTWDLTFRTRMSTGTSVPGVLDNDSDPDGDPLSIEVLTGPAHGTLTWGARGGFTYQSDANYSGLDSFTYQVNDGFGGTDTATVSLTVAPANDSPTAENDTATTNEDTPVIIDVLANDSDPDGDPLTVIAVSDPPDGTVRVNSDGTIIYTPDINFNGTDSFTYTVSDGNRGTDTATVSITVEEMPESTLIVTIDPSSIHETDGAAAATGTVTRSGDLSQAVVIELTSSDPSEVAVPETVTIQAGEDSATFSIDAVDDRLEDGTQTVTITATMSTSPGSGTVELVLDESFGGDGTVDPSGGTTDVALGPDGKIVVVGYQQINDPQNPENHRDLLITRYHSDGSLDTTFGGDGTVTTDVTGEIDEPHAVAVQSDGKILVGGHVYNGPSRDWLLVRYNVDGSLDTTFGGGDGIVITDPGDGSDHIHDLLILPDGKIVVAGDINSDEAFGTSDSYDDFAVARYNANGTLDTSFAGDGIATTQFAGRRSDTAFALARQADGKIVLAGTTGGGNFDSEFALARYNIDGTRDSSFGGNGSVTVDVPGEYERGFDLLIQSDGKIVVVGQVGKAGTSPPNYDTALTRLNPDGTLDLSFGADGFVVSDLGAGDAANGVALTNDGRIVIAGPGLALYNSDGTLQANDSSIPTGQNLVVLPDGRILVAGTTVLERYRIIQSISDTATIDVLDVPENDAPDANSDEIVTDQGQAVTIDVLANDIDLDGDTLTVTDVTDPNGGTATINTDGTITFTPDPDFAGTTQFEYTVSDGKGGTSQATVYLSIYGPAEIRGMVWNDLDGDGVRDTGEPGLANRTVYLDLNDNGIRDQTSRLGIDPGDFARQTILSDLLPQATLSAIDGQGTIVAPVNALGGRSLSSPADIFGHASDSGAEDVLWSTGFRELRIDFHVPVRSVSIDVRGYGSSSRGRLSLYDANGNLIDSYVSDILGRQVFQTMTLSATVDIAYAIVGADNSVLLDDLRFTAITPEPTATTDANGDYIFTDILPGEYVVRQELPEGVTQTAPHNENGDFYGVHATRLYKINAVTGEVQRIGPQDGQTPIHGLAYTNAGKLFGLRSLGNDPPSLFEIDLATGVATVIGPIGRSVRSGLAYDHNTDTLYGLGGHDDGTTGLLILNRNTGAATPFGEGVATGINAVSGVAFDAANNRVIAFDNYDDEFWAFDVNTGAATLLGNIAPFAGYGFTETDTALVMQFANSQDGGERFVAVNPDNGTFSHFLTLDDAIGTFEALEFVAGDPYAHHIDLAPGQTATAINFGNQDINDPPVANSSSFSTDEDTPYSGNVTGSDPESQALTYFLGTGSTHGEMELNPDGSFTYTPNDNFQGTDFFTFTVSDGNLTSSPATVSITVGAVNDAPLFAASSYDFSIAENSAAGTPVGTTAATDADGDSLAYSITAGNDAGAFAINAATGEITVADASALDFETTTSFTLTVQATDGTLTGQATVAITLTDVVAPQVAGVDFGYGQDQWANTESLQGRTAPWQITRVRVRFTQDVLVDINDLVITGTNGNYAFSDFTYNATTFTAVWTLATPIEQDRVTMNLDWEPAAADGNEAMSAGSEELIEDELSAALDVLYGDVSDDGMVDLWDALLMRTRNTTSDPWADINGDGIVDLTDALLLRTRNGTHLP